MVCDAGEDIGEPGLRIDIAQFGGADQRVHDGGALAAAIGAAEQPRFTAKGYAAQGALRSVVGDADPAVIEEVGERRPAAEHVVDGLREIVVARKLGELGMQPGIEIDYQRCAALLAGGEALLAWQAVHPTLDIEQNVEPLHGLERNRVDLPWSLTPALLAGCALDISKFEELPARMGEAACFEHRTGIAAVAIELAISTIGVGLQDAC